MKRANLHWIPLVAVALAGCAVGPDYKRPVETGVPATYDSGTNGWKIAQPQGDLPKGNWWEVFGDSVLNNLEAEAAVSNQQLKAAAARFEQARALTSVARAGYYPRVEVAGAYARRRGSANAPASTGAAIGPTSPYNDYAIPADLTYEVDLWGRVRRNVESARAQEQANGDDLQAITLSIQAELASDYFILRALDTELALLRSSVEVFRKSLELTKNRRAGGIISDLDVAQAETVLKSTQALLPGNALQRAQLEHAIAILTGRNAIDFRVPESVLTDSPPLIPAGLPSELLERRPDVSAAERRMAAANASIGVAKAAFFPTVKLYALTGLESLDAGSLFNWPSRFWSVGPSINMPIFEGGQLRANLRYAKAGYDETVANYRQSVLSAFGDVEDNLMAQSLLATQYEEQFGAMQAARRQLEISNNRYRDGLITYLEVSTAENTALDLERSTVRLRGQQLLAAVALVKSLGGGWKDPMMASSISPENSDSAKLASVETSNNSRPTAAK